MEESIPGKCANGDFINIMHTSKISFKCAFDKNINYLGVYTSSLVGGKNNSEVFFIKENQAAIDLKKQVFYCRKYEPKTLTLRIQLLKSKY